MKTTMRLMLAASLILAVGCKKKEEATGGDEGAEATEGAKASEGKPEAAKPAEPKAKVFEYASAKEFWDEYTPLDGKGVMDKYGFDSKVKVTGKVLRTLEEASGQLKVHLMVTDKQWISLSFADKGAKLKEAKVAKDAEITATCDIGGKSSNYIMLIKCES